MTRRILAVIAFAALGARAEAQAPPAQPRPAPAGAESRADRGEGPAPGQAVAAPGGQPGLPPLPAHLQKVPTPRTPPPGWALASYSEGRIYLRSVLPFPKPGSPDGAAPGAADVELASVAEPFDGRQVQARTAAGQAVRAEELARRLARETPVVVGLTTHQPDPTYLRVMKDDTLVILLPPPPQPAQGAAPAPAAGGPARPAGAAASPGAGSPAAPATAPRAPR